MFEKMPVAGSGDMDYNAHDVFRRLRLSDVGLPGAKPAAVVARVRP